MLSRMVTGTTVHVQQGALSSKRKVTTVASASFAMAAVLLLLRGLLTVVVVATGVDALRGGQGGVVMTANHPGNIEPPSRQVTSCHVDTQLPRPRALQPAPAEALEHDLRSQEVYGFGLQVAGKGLEGLRLCNV